MSDEALLKFKKIYRAKNYMDDMRQGIDPVSKLVNIDDIGIIDPFTTVLNSKFSKDLLAYIQQNCDEKLCSRLINEHSVVRLLYQMRNKIVHELSSLGAENKHGA